MVSETGVLVLQVEQRSELVDVVTKLAKEEAAAEKGAAAAAKADPASAAAGDKTVSELREQDGKRNAAAALKQVAPLGMSVNRSCVLPTAGLWNRSCQVCCFWQRQGCVCAPDPLALPLSNHDMRFRVRRALVMVPAARVKCTTCRFTLCSSL